ncbi:MAG: ABC transporter substrate-binding protein [Desulfopila sp.]
MKIRSIARTTCSLSVLLFLACLGGLTLFTPDPAPGADDEMTLHLALLPVPDVFPAYVARQQGYFQDGGITVEILPVGSAVERDQLLQAGRIDGMVNEVGGAMLFNRDRVQMKIVSFARIPLGDAPLFRVLAAPGTAIASVADLAGVPVAVSMNTVIEYVSTRLLESGGVAESAIRFASVPVLPERLQLLLTGQLAAATLPEPLGSAAIQAGAVEVVSDLKLAGLSASVISFSSEAVRDKEEAVKRFMVAWNRAVVDLNADSQRFQPLLLQTIRVPKNVVDTYRIPPYPGPSVPSRDQWDDVLGWMQKKQLITTPVSYDDSVTTAFLPR